MDNGVEKNWQRPYEDGVTHIVREVTEQQRLNVGVFTILIVLDLSLH